MSDSVEQLIKECREVINTISDADQTLSLKQFDKVLRQGETLRDKLEATIYSVSGTQNTLLQLQEKLNGALNNQGALANDAMTAPKTLGGNPFGMFGTLEISTREGAHVDEFDFQRPEF